MCASEQLLNKEGVPMSSNFIIASHFIINEITNQISEMESQLKNDFARKSRNDYLNRMIMETEFAELKGRVK